MTDPIYRIGPCHVFLGNPNIPNGAGMTFLGFTRDTVEFNPNVNISFGKADQTGTAGLAESVYFGGYAPVATVPLIDEDKDKLAAYMHYGAKLTANGQTSLGGGSGFKYIPVETIGTLALIPSAQLEQGTNGIDAKQAIWMPAVIANDLGAWGFETPDSSDDAMNRRSTQFMGLRLEHDRRPAAAGGAALAGNARRQFPTSHRIWWIGSPRSLSATNPFAGFDWSLPVAPLG